MYSCKQSKETLLQHEVNNLLQVVQLLSSTLQQNLNGKVNESLTNEVLSLVKKTYPQLEF